MQVQLRWFDVQSGTVQEAALEAETVGTAVQQAEALGHVVLASGPAARNRAGKAPHLSWWCRELRTLLLAGMTVVEALETLQAQSSQSPAQQALQAELLAQLRQGKALSTAMAASGLFPAVLVAGVKAGEKTSGLALALEDFVRYDDMLQALRRKAVSASLYPALVFVLGSRSVLFLLFFVMPRFSQMYGDSRGPLSFATQGLLIFSALLAHWKWPIFGLLVCLVGALAWAAHTG
jgi:general secretion pathway protein F